MEIGNKQKFFECSIGQNWLSQHEYFPLLISILTMKPQNFANANLSNLQYTILLFYSRGRGIYPDDIPYGRGRGGYPDDFPYGRGRGVYPDNISFGRGRGRGRGQAGPSIYEQKMAAARARGEPLPREDFRARVEPSARGDYRTRGERPLRDDYRGRGNLPENEDFRVSYAEKFDPYRTDPGYERYLLLCCLSFLKINIKIEDLLIQF